MKNCSTDSSARTLGRLLEVVGLAFLVADAVYLNLEGHNLAIAAVILITGIFFSIIGRTIIFGSKGYEREKKV